MKEKEPPFRNYLVCYDGERCIDWKNVAELNELLNQDKVDWYFEKGERPIRIKVHDERNG